MFFIFKDQTLQDGRYRETLDECSTYNDWRYIYDESPKLDIIRQ